MNTNEILTQIDHEFILVCAGQSRRINDWRIGQGLWHLIAKIKGGPYTNFLIPDQEVEFVDNKFVAKDDLGCECKIDVNPVNPQLEIEPYVIRR